MFFRRKGSIEKYKGERGKKTLKSTTEISFYHEVIIIP